MALLDLERCKRCNDFRGVHLPIVPCLGCQAKGKRLDECCPEFIDDLEDIEVFSISRRVANQIIILIWCAGFVIGVSITSILSEPNLLSFVMLGLGLLGSYLFMTKLFKEE